MSEFEVVCGDAVTVLSQLRDESVQMCVTSPPYFGLRDYGIEGQIGLDESPYDYVERLVEVFREVCRVLRNDGTLWCNLGDSYAANRSYQVPSTKGGPKHSPAQGFKGSAMRVPEGLKPKDLMGIPWRVAFALQADGWYLRSDVIWEKPNAMPQSVTDRPTTSHEYLFLLSKNERYYYDHEAVKEPAGDWTKKDKRYQAGAEPKKRDAGEPSRHAVLGHPISGLDRKPIETRNRRTVWAIQTESYKGAHFATFPQALVEPCVLAGSPASGDAVVLDPFCGSGTAGLVATRLGRSFLGIDLNPEYCEMARKRITQCI